MLGITLRNFDEIIKFGKFQNISFSCKSRGSAGWSRFKGVLGILQPKDRYFREFVCGLDLTVLSLTVTDFNELGCFGKVRHSSSSIL